MYIYIDAYLCMYKHIHIFWGVEIYIHTSGCVTHIMCHWVSMVVAHVNVSFVTWLIRDMTHSYVNTSVTWLIRMWMRVWHDSFVCVPELMHMCDMTHAYVWHDSCICVTWLVHMCDMTHAYVWHDSCICVTWLMHMCDMTHAYVWHDSCICVTWLMHMCDMTRAYVCHDSYIYLPWLMHMCRSALRRRNMLHVMLHVSSGIKMCRNINIMSCVTHLKCHCVTISRDVTHIMCHTYNVSLGTNIMS